ncbi:MAG: tetratricopeptide repeat protein [Pirellulaceae bacterium]
MSPDADSEASAEPLEEHTVSPALRRRLQQIHEHAHKLFEQEKMDFDYVHSMLVECVVQDPGNLVYLETMLQNLHRKYGNNKRGARLKGFGGRGPFKKAVAKKDWKEVSRLGPDLLKTNPWDIATLRALAEACAAYGYNDVELRYLKNALEAKPHDVKVNRHCAMSLARMGQYDQAIACWHRVDEAKRGDEEAQKMMSELQIEKTRQQSGNTGEEAPRGRIRKAKASPHTDAPEEPSSGDEPKRRAIQLTPRQELEQQLVNNPADREASFDLADLYVGEHRLADATHVLQKALAATGNDVTVQERLEDVEILRKKHQVEIAEKRAAHDKDEQTKQLAEQLRTDLNRVEWEIFLSRSDRYPQDLEIKFQLGLRLKRCQRYEQAMECFRESHELPDRRAGSLLELGECWQRQKQYDKALERYRQAAEQAGPDHLHLKKLALYRVGVLATGLKNLDSAVRYLEELTALDPAYEDAASRLDKIREMRHSD